MILFHVVEGCLTLNDIVSCGGGVPHIKCFQAVSSFAVLRQHLTYDINVELTLSVVSE